MFSITRPSLRRHYRRRFTRSDVQALASGQKARPKSQGQAKPNRCACGLGLWLAGLMKAKPMHVGQAYHMIYPKLLLTTMSSHWYLCKFPKIKLNYCRPFMDRSDTQLLKVPTSALTRMKIHSSTRPWPASSMLNAIKNG